jgi:energy-coupling factor transport system ATP-binding protein
MLKVESLSYRHAHSDHQALKDVSFTLDVGQSLILSGRSGSGKSTLLSILAGLTPHFLKGTMEGRAELDGVEAGQGGVAEWGKGAALMLQNPEAQFLAGSVGEEILLTLRCRGVTGQEADTISEDRLRSLGLTNFKDHSVFKLSEGQKQKAVLAALTALRPKLLLLDEPSANLDPLFLEDLKKILASLQKEGLSLIVADHRLYWLEGLCDRILVLDGGRLAYDGSLVGLSDEGKRQELGLRSPWAPRSTGLPPPSRLRPDQLTANIGFGQPSEIQRPEAPAGSPDNRPFPGSRDNGVIKIENLHFNYPDGPELFGGLSLTLACGEVTALTGPSGLGKTTLARLLCGLEKPAMGTISFDGRPTGLELGQVILQNADHQLYMPTVLAEVVLAIGLGKRDLGLKTRALEILKALGLSQLADRNPQSLSGGEKQRLVVAVGLARPTRLLALDEPTSGLDGHNLNLMASQIRKAAQAGPAVLVVTHDLELVNLCADRQLELTGPIG